MTYDWFDAYDPFDAGRTDLQSLFTGLLADETTNCDKCEEVGKMIQSKLDGYCFAKATVKRADQVKTFGHLTNVVKINKSKVIIDPTKLFTRLIVLMERSNDIVMSFKHELTHIPTSLFSENMMRNQTKVLVDISSTWKRKSAGRQR